MVRARRNRVGIAAVAIVVLAAGLLTACGDDAEPRSRAAGPATYVGTLPGTDAFVAIATSGSRIRAYVCDSRTVATWFDGSVADGSASLTAAGGQRLEARLADGPATGSVTLKDGRARTFVAVPADGDAGLYRGTDGGTVAGWIVLADGAQRGGIGGSPAKVTAAPRLSSSAIADGRVAITPIPIPDAGPQLTTIRIAPNGGLR